MLKYTAVKANRADMLLLKERQILDVVYFTMI